MSALSQLANMLGVAPRLAEDAMYSERAAHAVLTRRNLFAAAGAMTAGSVMAQMPAFVWQPDSLETAIKMANLLKIQWNEFLGEKR